MANADGSPYMRHIVNGVLMMANDADHSRWYFAEIGVKGDGGGQLRRWIIHSSATSANGASSVLNVQQRHECEEIPV